MREAAVYEAGSCDARGWELRNARLETVGRESGTAVRNDGNCGTGVRELRGRDMLAKIIFILYFIVMNFLGIASMASDKIRAMERRFRVPEAVLIMFAVLGGSIGSIAGMLLFHHKIRIAKFRIGLPLILAAQIGIIVLLRLLHFSIVFI